MTPEHWAEVKEILGDALEIADAVELTAFLERRCQGNAALLTDVRRLLSAHREASGGFLDKPVIASDGVSKPLDEINFGNRYTVDYVLGRGGVSVVYLGRDRQMAMRTVVLKTLNDHAARNNWIRSKFRHEMEALTRIRHPNVVQALDFFTAGDGRAVLVMEYVHGPWLRDEIVAGGCACHRVESLLRQIGNALMAAHAQGVQHRDLKPENVILRASTDGEVPTLIDFGIAKLESPEHAVLTDTVVLAGTTGYMAPEQLLGKSSAKTDQYALAVIAFELLTGVRPYYPATPVQLFEMQRTGTPPDPRRLRGDLPPGVTGIMRKAMAFDANQRYSSVEAFLQDLSSALHGEVTQLGKQSRRRWMVAAGSSIPVFAASAAFREPIEDFVDFRRSVETVIAWDGTTEPANDGWELRHDLFSRWESNAEKTGFRGLHLFTKSMGVYIKYWSRAQKKAAINRGWKFVIECEAIEGFTGGLIDLTPFRPRFDIHVRMDAGGQQRFVLQTRMKPTLEGPEFAVGRGVHRYELISAAGSREAQVSIDGQVISSNYVGHTDYQEDKNLLWGVGKYKSEKAEGVVRQVRFELL